MMSSHAMDSPDPETDPRSIVLIHGYGLRSPFWRSMKTRLQASFAHVVTPDLEMPSIDAGIAEITRIARQLRDEHGHPVILVGHSLGGVMSAMAARALPVDVVCHLVVIAAPYGESMTRSLNPLTRLALRFRLIPKSVLRARFFGTRTPKKLQKELFSQAVDEAQEVRDVANEDKWFHTHAFEHGLPQRSLVIASEADRIVNPSQTMAFGEALGARTHLFQRSLQIGHDDFGILPAAADVTSRVIEDFVGG